MEEWLEDTNFKKEIYLFSQMQLSRIKLRNMKILIPLQLKRSFEPMKQFTFFNSWFQKLHWNNLKNTTNRIRSLTIPCFDQYQINSTFQDSRWLRMKKKKSSMNLSMIYLCLNCPFLKQKLKFQCFHLVLEMKGLNNLD